MEITLKINNRKTYRLVIDAPGRKQANDNILEALAVYGTQGNMYRVEFNDGNVILAFSRDRGAWDLAAGGSAAEFDHSMYVPAIYAFAAAVTAIAFGEYPFANWEPKGSVLAARRIQFAGHDEELRDLHTSLRGAIHRPYYEGAEMIWFDEVRSQPVKLLSWVGSTDPKDIAWLVSTQYGRTTVPEYRLVSPNQPVSG
jgi:hypothetical protein